MRVMNFENSARSQDLQTRVAAFMDQHVYPNESTYHHEIAEGDRWLPTAIVEELKPKARAAGLWNLFLPESEYGAGLTNVEYAPLCEIMGRVPGFGSEVFNCSAPDTGNMEVLVRHGSAAQRPARLAGPARSRLRAAPPARPPARAAQHRAARRAARRRLHHQRPQMVDLRRRRP